MLRKNKKIVSICTMVALLLTGSIMPMAVKADAASTESSRIWGQDRYETAAKVSQKGWTSSDYVVIASGEGYADALCAAPLAKANDAPILLTENGKLNDKTLEELKRLNVKHVYIIGGEGSVSKKVEDTIKSQVTSDIQRLWGQDRYETSVKVAGKFNTPTKVVLASGDGYADALSAAPVAAIEGMPILLTESKRLSKPTADYIKSNSSITKTYVIGGYASVNDATMGSVPSPQRLGGADRFETNSSVVNAFSADFDFKNAYVVLGDGPNGNEFADALTGAALAAKNKNPLIITSKVLSESTKALIKAKLNTSSTLNILGGVANISDVLVSEMVSLRGTSVPGSGSSSGGSGGSSSGGSQTTNVVLSTDGSTYTDNVSGNAEITGNNITLKGNVQGDVTIKGNNSKLSGITVGGTVYIDPGKDGTAALDTVTAKNVVILSGASNSIDLNNLKADILKINSISDVHVKSEGSTSIGSTTIISQAIIEVASGSFGSVQIAPSSPTDTITLGGSFTDVNVTKPSKVSIAAGATLKNVVIDTTVTSPVGLSGPGTIKNIQNKSTSVVSIDKSIAVTGIVEAVDKNTIQGTNTDAIRKTEQKPISQMTDLHKDYTNITKSVSDAYGQKIQDYLKAHPTLDKYLDITTGDVIQIKLTNCKWTKVSEMFETAKAEAQSNDRSKFDARIGDIQKLLDMPFIVKTNIGGKTAKVYLENAYSSCFTGENLDKDKIAKQLKDGTLSYNSFITNLKNSNPTIGFKLSDSYDLTIDKIDKDDSTIYDKTWTGAQNVGLLDKDNISDLTGNYTIYSGKYTISIKLTN